MDNPLLNFQGLPPFSRIKPQHVEPAVDEVLASNRSAIEALLNADKPSTFDNLVRPLEDLGDRLRRLWSPVSHMNAVVDSEPLRAAYHACLPKLSEYTTELGQNAQLYRAYQAVAVGPASTGLEQAQRKLIENALRDFRLSGVDLPEDKRARFKAIVQELSSLQAKFEENLLDATNAWSKHLTDPESLKGLPPTALALAAQAASRRGLSGWLVTLELPSYLPVITYADDRSLRREIYEAYVTRASDVGPYAGKWDNMPIMERILALRHQAAQLLGFGNYAEYSLASKMAHSTGQVMEFLSDLARRSLNMARGELQEIQAYAHEWHGMEALEAWDVPYYAEKLREHRYAISQEDLKPYFPQPQVLAGMFEIVRRLYGIDIRERFGIDVWHPDVHFYEIYDADDTLRGQFYLDLYARPHKRGGAWMDECITRKRDAQGIHTPVAFLTCNFSPPIGDHLALFTHGEVVTLFHEFGHGLHFLLTQMDYPAVSGTNGVPWDAVELPSQFMENWCWQREALDVISGHFKTKQPLPNDLFQKMLAAKNFQAGMHMVRQLEFSLFDFRLHMENRPLSGLDIYKILDEVRTQVAVMKPPAFNRFPHSFSHIFAGGYAAGYYSYKWAEVLSSDAFSLFEEKGTFDRQTGLRFLHTILEQGGSRDPMELFVTFRGREPTIDALLRHNGIVA